jgi:rRNA maturation endonuclease Nob1
MLKWPKCRGQEPTFDHTAEIQKQGAHEEAVEPEPEERSMRVLNLTERLGLAEGGIKAVEETDWTEQRAATISETIVRMLALYDEILEEKNSTSRRISVLDFVSHFQRTVYYWTQDVTIQKTRLQFSLLLKLSLFVRFHTFVNFS